MAADKRLVDWNREQVVAECAGRREAFKYPDLVLGPEAGQQETFDQVMPGLIDSFLAGYNCTFIAYGQTGTGKTHTMFGAPGSLKSFASSGLIHPEWGIFPRAVLAAMKAMASREGVTYLFTASVVDLYMFQFHDLLNKRAKVVLPPGDSKLSGYKEYRLETAEDVKHVVNTAMSHRVMSGTKCNDTSSRSHCVASIKLLTLGNPDGKIVERSFMFADLAGSERVNRTEEAKWVDRASHQFNLKGMEGICTNWDLYQLGMQLELISQSQRQRKHAQALMKKDSRLAMLLKKSLDGEALTSLVVCLSQAPSNGGESWCSLQYGAKFAHLVTRVLPQKS